MIEFKVKIKHFCSLTNIIRWKTIFEADISFSFVDKSKTKNIITTLDMIIYCSF